MWTECGGANDNIFRDPQSPSLTTFIAWNLISIIIICAASTTAARPGSQEVEVEGEQQINAMKFIISVVSSSVSVGQFEVYISVDLSRVCLNLDFEQTLSLSLLKEGFKVKV